jgi:hypothetical protein
VASRAGSPNKNKAFLLAKLQEMYGEEFHPIMNMAKNAVTIQRQVDVLGDAADVDDLLNANKAWEGIAQYVEPKLKAVEHQIGDGSEGTLTISWKS